MWSRPSRDPHYALAFARIENHHFVNRGFFDDGQLIRVPVCSADIPGVIIQGCQLTSARP
jgi:proline iminopeptidase